MQFECDERKAERNLRAHGVLFTEAETVFDDPLFLAFADSDHSRYEQRYIIMGESNKGRVLVVAYTVRGSVTRIISARKATRREKRFYEENI
jgi:uncharacterized DUF497 family protein